MVLLLLTILLGDLFMNMTEILAEEKVFINATINSDVQLICPANETEIYPTWFKRLGDNASDCNLATGNRINKDDPLSTRMKLEGFTKGFYNLMIANITINDTGLYCCTTVNDLTPTEFCTQLYIPEGQNVGISILKRNDTLECSVAGEVLNITFSWNHYSTNGSHISCHDHNGPVLPLTKFKAYESVGLYTCSATFIDKGKEEENSLQTSFNITNTDDVPSCFPTKNTSIWRVGETAIVIFYVYSLPEISYVWTSNDSSSYDANTKIFFNSTKEELYAVNMCNEIIHVKVVEYRIQIHNLTFQNLNFTLILHINNTVGSTNCSHIFLRNQTRKDDICDICKDTYSRPNTVVLKYIVGCFCGTVILMILSVSMRLTKGKIVKVMDCVKCRCRKQKQSSKVTYENRRYNEEVVLNPNAGGQMFIIQDGM